jgi:hypothetical protein
LLALLESGSQSAPTSPAGVNTSQDAVSPLPQGSDSSRSSNLGNGSDAQNALRALPQANSTASSNGSGTSAGTGSVSASDLAMAVSLYQAQLSQQRFGTMLGTGSTGV